MSRRAGTTGATGTTRTTAARRVALLTVVVLAASVTSAGPALAADPTGGISTAAVDTTFSFAVLPDTQQEVLEAGDPRFTQRAQWLSDRRTSLDLRYVTHTGDVVNWDTTDHVQYERTEPGVAVLDASGIPWSFGIGNHDTYATGEGGGARPGGNAAIDVRNTTTFNRYYGVGHADNLRGTFETGKIDNSWSSFSAGGRKWMILQLELWPRPEVVTWAQRVVKNHPSFNVAVVTHAFLNSDGSVQTDNGGYGSTSPQTLLNKLVLRYPNVRFVFSGHAGVFAAKNFTGVNGNPVSAIQTTYHSNDTNPVRVVTVNTATNAYSSKVYAAQSDEVLDDGSATYRSGMAWVG